MAQIFFLDYTLYTVRDTDVVITSIKPQMEHVIKGTFPGRAPMLLVGPDGNDHKKYIVCTTRDGKGIVVASNDSPYKVIATKEVSVELLFKFKLIFKIETTF